MEQYPSIPMERTTKIIRRSIHTFLQNYHYFTSIAVLLVFPYSITALLSQAVVPSSSPLLLTIHVRLQSLFSAAGFPPSSQFFSLVNLKLSQIICSSLFTLPFTFSFFLIAKAAIILVLNHKKLSLPPSFSSFLSLFNSLFITHLCNSFVILSANATAFSLLFLAFNSFEAFGFSSPNFLQFLSAVGAVMYSVILANTLIICNLALIVAGMEDCVGYFALLRACVLIRGRTSTALSLAVPLNLGLAAVEALFHYRIIRAYSLSDHFSFSMVLEGMLIAYLYSILILLDTVTGYIFFKSCKLSFQPDYEHRYHHYQIQFAEEEDNVDFTNMKTLQEFP